MLDIILALLFWFGFGVLLTTLIVEIVLSVRWNKQYFGAGTPIFIIRIPVKDHQVDIPSCSLMESNFKSEGLIRNTSLLFEKLDVNMMGFRESWLQLGRWYSIMHGLLIFDVKSSQIIVKGFLDWTALCFAVLWVIIGPLLWLLGFIPLGEQVLFGAFLYFGILFFNLYVACSIDYRRYTRVAKFAAQKWSLP